MSQTPSIGRIVHYVSYGTPGGEYRSQCRAAIVTSVHPVEHPADKAYLIEDGYDVALCVLNPEGQFFNRHVPYEQWDSNEASEGLKPKGGTWHWPERTDEPGQVEPEPEIWNPYRERAALVAHLAAIYPAAIAYNDPAEPDWPVIYVTTPHGQLSWHLSEKDGDLFPHVPLIEGDAAPTWDGHTTAEKYERLAACVRDTFLDSKHAT